MKTSQPIQNIKYSADRSTKTKQQRKSLDKRTGIKKKQQHNAETGPGLNIKCKKKTNSKQLIK